MGCLYEIWNGIISGTGKKTKLEDYSNFSTSLFLRLYEAGTFFIPSRVGGIPLAQNGIRHNQDKIFHTNTAFKDEKRPVLINFSLYIIT